MHQSEEKGRTGTWFYDVVFDFDRGSSNC